MTKPTNEEMMRQYCEVMDLATKLHGDDLEDACVWTQTPSEFLFGWSPTEVVFMGDGEILLNWLRERAS